MDNQTVVYSCAEKKVAIRLKQMASGIRYVIRYLREGQYHSEEMDRAMQVDLQRAIRNKIAYFESLPTCKSPEYEELYYKTLSVQKVNTHSPEGNIPCFWTTPDRVPHRNMWLWDSVFHAIAIGEYNISAAEDAIWAVLTQIHPDGMIPHMMNPVRSSDTTQPPILSYGVWLLFEKSNRKEYLKKCVPYLEKYLTWDLENRDQNRNGLLEWHTDPGDLKCRCGESGLDNSPRFDFDEDMDAVDFSAFFANDALYLSKIYHVLGESALSEKWKKLYDKIKNTMNSLLWDEAEGIYCDRLIDGNLTHVLSCAGFLPIFAGIPEKKQVERMVSVLRDPQKFRTPFRIPSISKNHPTYSTDMWRGGVWININYFVILGLLQYGFTKEAEELRTATLEMILRWYRKEGSVFEFYDPENRISPLHCLRKGEQPEIPDWRRHVHSIVDYNWSSCLTMKLIQMQLVFDSSKNERG